jgi:hypothetical protein
MPVLLLHAIGERNVGRIHAADGEDEIGLEREHDFEIGGVAASGDAADLRPPAHVGQKKLALGRRIGARPADQAIRRQRVEQDGRRGAGGKHALDPRRNRHRASGAVGHARGAGTPRGEQRGRRGADHQGATIDHGNASQAGSL